MFFTQLHPLEPVSQQLGRPFTNRSTAVKAKYGKFEGEMGPWPIVEDECSISVLSHVRLKEAFCTIVHIRRVCVTSGPYPDRRGNSIFTLVIGRALFLNSTTKAIIGRITMITFPKVSSMICASLVRDKSVKYE